MIRQEAIVKNQRVIGVLHIAEWGVIFEPIDSLAAFEKVQLKTLETMEAARLEVLREVNQQTSAR